MAVRDYPPMGLPILAEPHLADGFAKIIRLEGRDTLVVAQDVFDQAKRLSAASESGLEAVAYLEERIAETRAHRSPGAAVAPLSPMAERACPSKPPTSQEPRA